MSKCETFDNKQTNWMGLWWHPENGAFYSQTINVSVIKQFKGCVRLYVRKNKYFDKGENGRPNYCFCLRDSHSDKFVDMQVVDEKRDSPYKEDETYYTEDGERLYTREEVQYAINRAAEDGARGYGWGDNIVSDYL